MSPVPTIGPPLRRRGLAAAAATAGAGAAVALLALSSTSTTSVAALAPVSGSASAETVAAPAAGSVTAARSTPRAAYTRTRAADAAATRASAGKAAAAATRTTSSAKSCAGMSSTADAFLQHVYAAHLEASPGQQVADITDVDQYVKTHTVMVENMLEPLVGGGGSALDAFLQHVYAAHLEASPGQQVADITDIDQYVKTHTVMLEQMIAPLAGGSCSERRAR